MSTLWKQPDHLMKGDPEARWCLQWLNKLDFLLRTCVIRTRKAKSVFLKCGHEVCQETFNRNTSCQRGLISHYAQFQSVSRFETFPSRRYLLKDVSVNCRGAVSHRKHADNAATPEAIYLIFFLLCTIAKQRQLRKKKTPSVLGFSVQYVFVHVYQTPRVYISGIKVGGLSCLGWTVPE